MLVCGMDSCFRGAGDAGEEISFVEARNLRLDAGMKAPVLRQCLSGASGRNRLHAVVSVVAFSLLTLAPVEAAAYRTFADDPEVGVAAHWEGEFAWEVDPGGQLPSAMIQGALENAWLVWAASDCVSMQFSVGDAVMTPEPSDSRNSVVGVPSGWTAMGFSPERAATTDVQLVVDADGVARIVEADIYLNTEMFSFSEDGTDDLDLGAVLIHELGHALGLLHVCEDIPEGAPLCLDVEAETPSVMHPDYGRGTGRALGGDDVAGVCSLYASATCPGSGCAAECFEDEDCTAGVCARGGVNDGRCVLLGDRGAGCGRGEDCASGLCVTSASSGSYCTSSCPEFESEGVCGEQESCQSIAGRSVCAPRPAGCAVSPTTGSEPTVWDVFWGAAAWALWRRRRWMR